MASELRARRLSSVELVRERLARIEASQGKLNAFTAVTAELALSAAAAARRRVACARTS
jgi:Asp-tRNA(Asn)/Glu-tRNA(Gln) amidotransferase A subunit family amidase